jgi:transposase
MIYDVYMPHLYKKISGGRTYWYWRETHRVAGKVRLKWQKYLGTAESIVKRLQEAERLGRPIKQHSAPFGALFVADVLERELGTIGLVNELVPRAANEKGPTVGEYFFYAWVNRLIAPRSKRALEQWYRKTAIQQIRPVDVRELSSERYWEKWDRVSEAEVEEIGRRFLRRLWRHRPQSLESLLFDTTNYYTYMATKTKSALAVRGHNKSGKHHLRQVGLGLLLDRQSELPLYYKLYPGNLHDAKLFHRVMDELFGMMLDLAAGQRQLTVVFDKGMNADENIAFIDGHRQIHFITTYSPYFVEGLATLDPKHFVALQIPKNERLRAKGRQWDQLLAYRSTLTLWGRERTVVLTFNPATERKKLYELQRRMTELRAELLEYRRRYREKERHWQSSKQIISRYRKLCEGLHISQHYYQLSFTPHTMSFRKDLSQIAYARSMMGKNLIVTDNHSWSTEQIVLASLDRYRMEKQFRASKASCHIRVNPMFHWTDSKIRCHLLSCVIALGCLRLLELKVGGGLSGKTILEEMHSLNCVLSWYPDTRKPDLRIDDPSPLQARILAALGHKVKDGSVLQA